VILVTGGTGFVGPKIVHALRAQGRDVRCLVRDPGAAGQLQAWGCELVRGDMTDAESLRRAVAGCEVVVHLVAILTGKPRDFERIMEQGTRDLVAAAKEAGVRRFVLMSALGTTEETKDLVPYYRAKWTMEQDVKASGLEHVIFRPSFVFGPDGGALQRFKRIARLSPVTPIVGSGTQRIQPIWVEDVAAYFAAAVDEPAAANRTFELGGPDVVTWNEFWDELKRALASDARASTCRSG
jgi:NADH dehydrogenase